MKIFFIDVETTGLDKQRCAIHQLAGIIEIDGKIIDKFDIRIRPFAGAEITQEALDTSKVTKDMISQYPPEAAGYKQLISKLATHVDRFNKKDKYHLAGYNSARFDSEFLREFFMRMGDRYYGSWFWSNPLDVMILAGEALKEVRHEMPNFQLISVAERILKIKDFSGAHNAATDVEWTREIYHAIQGAVKYKP